MTSPLSQVIPPTSPSPPSPWGTPRSHHHNRAPHLIGRRIDEMLARPRLALDVLPPDQVRLVLKTPARHARGRHACER